MIFQVSKHLCYYSIADTKENVRAFIEHLKSVVNRTEQNQVSSDIVYRITSAALHLQFISFLIMYLQVKTARRVITISQINNRKRCSALP